VLGVLGAGADTDGAGLAGDAALEPLAGEALAVDGAAAPTIVEDEDEDDEDADAGAGADAVVLVVEVTAAFCGVNGSRPRPASLFAPTLVSTAIAGSEVPVEYGRPAPAGVLVISVVGAFLESSSGTATRATISPTAIGHSLRSRSSLIMFVRTLIAVGR
jgi:hypothetical protein